MKIRLVCTLSLFGAIAFASTACDSSSTPPTDAGTDSSVTDAAVDAATDASVSDGGGTCVPPNQAYTADTLEATTNSSGSCSDSGDVAIICANDLEARAASCALSSCTAFLIGKPAELKSCITTCMTGIAPAPSTDCTNCYSDSVVCTATSCLAACAADANAPDCVSCRKTHACYSSFFECSGLPNVTPP